jgi:7-cyano-7-deazaguanine synthase
VPDAASPDEAVFLPGRNVLLLSKAILWCQLHNVRAVAMATLVGNPFPDATADFFEKFASVVNQAVGGHVRVLRPYARLNKSAILNRGIHLPLHLTFSCIRPVNGLHCGQCNKCAERKFGFRAANVADCTAYHSEEPCTA